MSKFTTAGTSRREVLTQLSRFRGKKKGSSFVAIRAKVKERYFFRPGRHRRWTMSGPREQPHSGQFFAGSRVSLVCNVCSRLLPKEWFAERPMASARANSRVPPPRHLCIIMLSPRTPALFSRALTLSLSFSPLLSSRPSPPLPSLRSLPPSSSLPPSLNLLRSASPHVSRPHPLPLSLHPCFARCRRKREREKERTKETKHTGGERAEEKERRETSRRRVMPKWIRRRVHERETERYRQGGKGGARPW